MHIVDLYPNPKPCNLTGLEASSRAAGGGNRATLLYTDCRQHWSLRSIVL